jgi:glycosyltransferase involved in cell wall biosynthesis
VDLDQVGGAVTTDRKTIDVLEKLCNVDVIYLEKKRHKSMVAALAVFLLKVLGSLSTHDTIYFSRGLISSTFLICLRPFARIRIVHQALSVPFPSDEVYFMPHSGFESRVRYYLFRFLEKTVLRRVDHITVASAEYADQLVDFGVPEGRIKTVPFMVEDAFFEQPVKEEGSATFSFCYAGRFHLYHVLVPLVQAFGLFAREERNVELILVGDGPSRGEIEREVVQRSLSDKVKFTGIVPHDRFPSFLSTVDCFVLLSKATGMPIGILEAAAAAKPIITLKRKHDVALDRYFKHGKEIYVVENPSPERIADALKRVYEDPNLRHALAKGARQVAQRYFSENAVKGVLDELLHEEFRP